MRQLCTIVLLCSLWGCHNYKVHPGSPSTQASVGFDILLVADAAIVEGKKQLTAGNLPATAKPVLNDLIRAYDSARAGLKVYSDVIGLGSTATAQMYLDQLTAELTEVQKALTAFRKVK